MIWLSSYKEKSPFPLKPFAPLQVYFQKEKIKWEMLGLSSFIKAA